MNKNDSVVPITINQSIIFIVIKKIIMLFAWMAIYDISANIGELCVFADRDNRYKTYHNEHLITKEGM